MLAREFGVAVGAQHQQRTVVEFGGQEREQPQRGRVGPVQVFEHQQQGRPLRCAAQETDDGVEQPEPRLRVVQRVGIGRGHGDMVGQFRHDAGDVDQRVAEGACRVGVATAAQVAADQLAPGPVGRCAGLLQAAAPQHRHAIGFGLRRQLLRQPRLADAARAGQHHHLSVAPAGGGQRGRQTGEFLAPADEQCGGARGPGRW